MLSRTIKYTNPFTKQEVTEEHWFHIPNADLLEMDMEMHKLSYTSKSGETYTGMQAHWQKLVEDENPSAILQSAKDLIRRSYGKREGDKFLQSEELWKEFSATEAYSQLRWDLCTDAELMGEFFNGIFSADLQAVVAEVAAKNDGIKPPEIVNGPIEDPTGLSDSTTPQVLTRAEALEMDSEELSQGLAAGKYKLT